MNAQAWTLSRDAEILSSCDANNNGEIDTPRTYWKTRSELNSDERNTISSENRCKSKVSIEISRRNIEESRRNIEKYNQILDMLWDS
jgi:hypothetical protein